jgi:hypothetical protein
MLSASGASALLQARALFPALAAAAPGLLRVLNLSDMRTYTNLFGQRDADSRCEEKPLLAHESAALSSPFPCHVKLCRLQLLPNASPGFLPLEERVSRFLTQPRESGRRSVAQHQNMHYSAVKPFRQAEQGLSTGPNTGSRRCSVHPAHPLSSPFGSCSGVLSATSTADLKQHACSLQERLCDLHARYHETAASREVGAGPTASASNRAHGACAMAGCCAEAEALMRGARGCAGAAARHEPRQPRAQPAAVAP